MKRLLSIVVIVMTSSPAWSQHIELSPIIGYTTEANIDDEAREVEDLAVSSGIAWGAQGTYFITERVGLEALWTYQSTPVSIASNGSTGELFTMRMNEVLGNLVYQFRGEDAPLTPFVFGGLGATLLDAPDLEGETKFSWTIGGGVKWFPLRNLGIRGHARYRPTQLNDSGSDFCSPFGFCQTSLSAFEVATGAVFRF
jgi:opacity protein-like surface antigen